MSNSTTSLSIVKELHRLAQNPAHREYLLRNDVNSILIFVDPDEHPVEVVSSEAIESKVLKFGFIQRQSAKHKYICAHVIFCYIQQKSHCMKISLLH